MIDGNKDWLKYKQKYSLQIKQWPFFIVAIAEVSS